MNEPAAAQSLTWSNLERLQGYVVRESPDPFEDRYWERGLPADELERAKQRVVHVLRGLRIYCSGRDQCCHSEDVYQDDQFELRYRGTAVPEPDLQDPSFWEAKWRYLEDKYGHTIKLGRAKYFVHWVMRDLRDSGPECLKVLDDYELYITEDDDIGYRGNSEPLPDLEDVKYWRTQYKYLTDKYAPIRAQELPPESYLKSRWRRTTEYEEHDYEWKRAHKYKSGWVESKQGVKAWLDGTQDTGKGYAQSRIEITAETQ